jgi:glycosyltransferase involved in cell wall biosynthesis
MHQTGCKQEVEKSMAGRLLEVLPSVARKVDGELELDVDFCETLELCLEHFDHVSVACPVTKDNKDSGLRLCRRVKDLPWRDRIKLFQLPNAYDLSGFIRNYGSVRRLLESEIKKSDYLLFSPHTLVGDWPTVGIREAIKLRRSYAIEADIVYESVAQITWVRNAPWKRFIKKNIILPLFKHSYRYCLKHSSVALFTEQDVYDAYSPFVSNPHKISSNIPIYEENRITDAQLQSKLDGLAQGSALKLCYVGRAIDMKGAMDWMKTVHELIKRGVGIRATWLGDGSLLADMRAMAKTLGITEYVSLPGFVSEQVKMETLKDSEVFLFCHMTREAPRCLGEALACGCPLIGYGSAYPKDLVAQYGGGEFATLGNWKELADIVQDLDKNRGRLSQLIRSASAWGRSYDRHEQLQRRVILIKENLSSSVP